MGNEIKKLIFCLFLALILSTIFSEAIIYNFDTVIDIKLEHPIENEESSNQADISFNTYLGVNGSFNITFINMDNSTSILTISFPSVVIHNLTTTFNESGRVQSRKENLPHGVVDRYLYQIPPNTTWIVNIKQIKDVINNDESQMPSFSLLVGGYGLDFEMNPPYNGTAWIRVIISEAIIGTYNSENSSIIFPIVVCILLLPILVFKRKKQ